MIQNAIFLCSKTCFGAAFLSDWEFISNFADRNTHGSDMKIKNVLEDFKTFAIKGNMVDMAVGIIIGGAFGKIITSLVNDIIMPPLGVLIGGVNFTDLKLTLKSAVFEAGNQVAPAVTLNYGNFLQVVFDFLIVAFAIFCFVRLLASLRKKKEDTSSPAPDKPSRQEELLSEIRDLLKEKK